MICKFKNKCELYKKSKEEGNLTALDNCNSNKGKDSGCYRKLEEEDGKKT